MTEATTIAASGTVVFIFGFAGVAGWVVLGDVSTCFASSDIDEGSLFAGAGTTSSCDAVVVAAAGATLDTTGG